MLRRRERIGGDPAVVDEIEKAEPPVAVVLPPSEKRIEKVRRFLRAGAHFEEKRTPRFPTFALRVVMARIQRSENLGLSDGLAIVVQVDPDGPGVPLAGRRRRRQA